MGLWPGMHVCLCHCVHAVTRRYVSTCTHFLKLAECAKISLYHTTRFNSTSSLYSLYSFPIVPVFPVLGLYWKHFKGASLCQRVRKYYNNCTIVKWQTNSKQKWIIMKFISINCHGGPFIVSRMHSEKWVYFSESARYSAVTSCKIKFRERERLLPVVIYKTVLAMF